VLIVGCRQATREKQISEKGPSPGAGRMAGGLPLPSRI
jgi:hypothetical protein